MLNTVTKHRLYCRECEDYTLHDRIYVDETKHHMYDATDYHSPISVIGHIGPIIPNSTYVDKCQCRCKHTNISIENIDKDKVQAQRKRYIDSVMINKTYPDKPNIVTDGKLGYIIIEDDAGLIELNNQALEAKRKNLEEKREVVESFKGVTRNEPCPCDSGIKYKKCCMSMVNDFKYELYLNA